MCKSLLRLLTNLIGHARGGGAAFKGLGAVEALNGGREFAAFRDGAIPYAPELSSLVAACLAAVAYAPSGNAPDADSSWMSTMSRMTLVQNLQWVLLLVIGVVLVGLLFFT